MRNITIASVFQKIAQFLELKGENPFRIRSYTKAAQTIQSLPEELESIYARGGLKELQRLPGIGTRMADKIEQLLTQGELPLLKELEREFPAGLNELLKVPFLGPKKALILYEKLNISSVAQLKRAIKEQKLRKLDGFGEKSEENLLKGIALYEKGQERMPLGKALPIVEGIIRELRKLREIQKIEMAGSLRRKKELIRDIDILVTSSNPDKVMEYFTTLPEVKQVLAKGKTKSSILTREDVQVDIRVIDEESWGSALMYFTGSKEHNIALRERVLSQKLKLNEYGLFRGNKKLAGRSEEEIFQALGLQYIPPELRENTGELEAAEKMSLPTLLSERELVGDLHVHSNWSDGSASLEEIADYGCKRGYKYIAICDHSKTLKVAQGLTEERLRAKIKAINALNSSFSDFRLLAGAEVDIKSDGTLDYSDELLRQLDFVIVAIHTGFKQTTEEMTQRVIKALRNPYVHAFAHPTGRVLLAREPYNIDIEKIIQAAKATQTFLELNAYPERLDLKDTFLRKAKEEGVLISIGTDAHDIGELQMMSYGVSQARRGWLTPDDVVNTFPLEKLLKILKKKN